MVGEYIFDDLIGVMNVNVVVIFWCLMGDGGNIIWLGCYINVYFIGVFVVNCSNGIECKMLFKVGLQVWIFGIYCLVFYGFEDKKFYCYIYVNGDFVWWVFFLFKSDGMNFIKILDDVKNIYGLVQVLYFKVCIFDLFLFKVQCGDGFYSVENVFVCDNCYYWINN